MMRMSTPRWSMCVAKLWRSECGRKLTSKPHWLRALTKAARAVASGRWRHQTPTGKEPLRAAVDLPDLAEHLEDRFGQRENPFLVPLPE